MVAANFEELYYTEIIIRTDSPDSVIESLAQIDHLSAEVSTWLDKNDQNKTDSLQLLKWKLRSIANTEIELLLRQVIMMRTKLDDLTQTHWSLSTVLDRMRIPTESAYLGEVGPVHTDTHTENVVDALGVDEEKVHVGHADTLPGARSDLEIHRFLERPVLIASGTGTVGSHIYSVLSVWDLWSSNVAVRAKLKNFGYLKGTLNLRVAFSGTPTHYGRVLLSYQPLAAGNDTLISAKAAYAVNTTKYRDCLVSYLSQAPGAKTLDISMNKPVHLKCPFISPKPMHRLFNTGTTAISAGTSFRDFLYAGDLFIVTLNAVRCAGASPTNVSYQVYAWMTDVELGTPTGTQLAITTESGSLVKDERKTGPVEKMASRMYQVFSSASSIPVIAPYARASAMVAKALEGLSAIFGWSKPVMMPKHVVMRPEPYANGALTIGVDTAKRIVLDPRQELTIDPRVCGVDTDDMIISEVASRPSYVSKFTWTTSSSPLSTVLWSARVSPGICSYASGTANTVVVPTAMMFASMPFAYWRGDIVFRFQINASKFHRGKLMLAYDPNISHYSLVTSNIVTNKQHVVIIDIQETQEFEICVKWTAARAWLKLQDAPQCAYNTSTPSDTVQSWGYVNGFVFMTPYTALQSATADNVEINVWAYCKNLQVNGLSDTNMPTARRIPTESGTLAKDPSPYEISCFSINSTSATTDHIAEMHFGEQPISFRALLKRYVTTVQYTNASDGGTGNHIYTLRMPIFGIDNLSFGTTAATLFDLLSYLRYGYLGMRGGMRWRINSNLTLASNINAGSAIKVSLEAPSTSDVGPSGAATNSSYPKAYIQGTVSFMHSVNPGMEVELPYYSNNLFMLACSSTRELGTSDDFMDSLYFRNFRIEYPLIGATTVYLSWFDSAIAEDFSLMRFQGAPFFSRALFT